MANDRKIVMYPVAKTFGIPAPKEAEVPGFAPDPQAPGAHLIPKADPNYKFRPELLRDLLGWWKLSVDGELEEDGYLAFGPQGSGKSSLIREVAARLNIPLVPVVGHERLEVADLIGSNTVLGGDMLFQDGPVTTACRLNCWFLLEEGDALDPSQQIGLNGIVERKSFVIPETGELVEPGKYFRFLATANTNFGGDTTGMFQGTKRQNVAFGDRFFFGETGYPTPEIELEIMSKKCPKIPEATAKQMIDFANMVRKNFMGEGDQGGSIEITMSTRTLCRWGTLLCFYGQVPVPIQYALDRAFALKAEPSTREYLYENLQRVFGQGGAV